MTTNSSHQQNHELNGEWLPLQNIDPHCFACGPDNPQGLHMHFSTDGTRIRAQLVVPEHVRGWSNIAHGGVTTTVLDETMAWACIYFLHQFPLTRDIQVRFRKPVMVGDQLIAVARLQSLDEKRRKLVISASLYNQQQQLVATAEGDFAPFLPADFAALKLVPEDDLQRLTAMFSEQPAGMPE